MSDEVGQAASKLFLKRLRVLLVESNSLELDILERIMVGFRTQAVHKCRTAEEALEHLRLDQVDLLIVDAVLPEMDGYDLVCAIRRLKREAVRTAPIILISGHTQARNVLRARDCGASFVLAKPVTPRVLFDRVDWLARDRRPFINAEAYIGPDRRFRNLGPPPGGAGRRQSDLPTETGDATMPSTVQTEMDALSSPEGVPG
jgi:DNA-binding response OmpR family regulator